MQGPKPPPPPYRPIIPKRRGRPALPVERGKRYPLGIRVTAEVKAAVQAAAVASGRSQAQEVEIRLEWSVLLMDRLVRIEAKLDRLLDEG
jgi:hypothetical protein